MGRRVTRAKPSKSFSFAPNSPLPIVPYTSRLTYAANFFSISSSSIDDDDDDDTDSDFSRGRSSLTLLLLLSPFSVFDFAAFEFRSFSSDSIDSLFSPLLLLIIIITHSSSLPIYIYIFLFYSIHPSIHTYNMNR